MGLLRAYCCCEHERTNICWESWLSFLFCVYPEAEMLQWMYLLSVPEAGVIGQQRALHPLIPCLLPQGWFLAGRACHRSCLWRWVGWPAGLPQECPGQCWPLTALRSLERRAHEELRHLLAEKGLWGQDPTLLLLQTLGRRLGPPGHAGEDRDPTAGPTLPVGLFPPRPSAPGRFSPGASPDACFSLPDSAPSRAGAVSGAVLASELQT